MKILGYGNDTGSWHWRLNDPLTALVKRGHQIRCNQAEAISEEAVAWADVIVLSSVVDKEGIALIRYYQQEKGKKVVVDSDDGLMLNDDSPFHVEHAIAKAADVIKITMEMADMVTVTTKHLAKQHAPLNKNVVVLPNCMDMKQWDIEPKVKNTSDQFRIGWAGSITHLEDLKMIIDPLKRIMDEFPQVKLIIVGETRIADYFNGYNLECMLGVEHKAWPSRLHGLALDLGLAPLRDTPFNRCKSNIKFQEYSINKIPGIFSPTVYNPPFGGGRDAFDGNLGHIAYNQEQWYRCMKNMILSKELREDLSDRAYNFVKVKYDLSKNAKYWERAYQSLLTQPQLSDTRY